MKKKFKFRKTHWIFILTGLILFVHGLSLVYPLFWMLNTSLKGDFEYAFNFFGLVEKPQWSNYKVLTRLEVLISEEERYAGIAELFGNSLILAVFRSFFSLVPVTLVSYALARYNFVGKGLLFQLNIVIMILPIVGNLSNTLYVYKQLGIYNNLWPYIIFPYIPFGFNMLLLYNVFKAIPQSYSEAVLIDGGGHWTIMIRVILPLAIPTLFTLYILGFIDNWNDYSSTLMYIRSTPTIAYSLYAFKANGVGYVTLPETLAAYAICSIPSVILYCSCQKLIARSLTVGGLKE